MIRRFLEWLVRGLPMRTITRDDGGEYLRRYYLLGEAGGLKYFPEDQRACRWWQKLTTWLPCVYVHRFMASDTDQALHNHPWCATSLILAGGYVEERKVEKGEVDPVSKFFGYFDVEERRLGPGAINRLKADTFHRVTLIEKDCWTLLVLGAKVQTWGFLDRRTGVFLHWRDHSKLRELQNSYASKGGRA